MSTDAASGHGNRKSKLEILHLLCIAVGITKLLQEEGMTLTEKTRECRETQVIVYEL